MGGSRARSFWDQRAREDPFFFVDNRLRYRRPDPERFWAEGERDLDTLLDALQVSIMPSDSVVEIGCGIGRLTRHIAARARFVWALDVSPRMIEIARGVNAAPNVRWLIGNGHSLGGIEMESAEACVSHVVFQHIPDPAVTLGYVREMGRILRPGGWAAFQVSNDARVHRPPRLSRRAVYWARGTFGRGPRGQGAAEWIGSAVELDDVESAARDGGMRLERVGGRGSQFCLVLARRVG